MNPCEINSGPLPHCLHLRGLGGGLGLYTSDLGGPVGLDGPLALADGGGAGNNVFAEVGAVVALGGGLDDGSEGPEFVNTVMFRVSVCRLHRGR